MAKALDVVGDRWTLLIVRELLLRGPCRYTDLQNGLPGVATNLLADRLRNLEEEGVVRREAAPPPIATTLFRLTPRGEDLAPVMHALGRWGAPLIAERNRRDAFRSHWLAMPLGLYLTDRTPKRPPITIEVRTDTEPLLIETVGGAVSVRPGRVDNPDAVLGGPPELALAVLMGKLDLPAARARGLHYEGSTATLNRVQPRRSA